MLDRPLSFGAAEIRRVTGVVPPALVAEHDAHGVSLVREALIGYGRPPATKRGQNCTYVDDVSRWHEAP